MADPSVHCDLSTSVLLCGVSPLVWRRLLVISETSLAELHEILRTAFDWSGEHLHRFLVYGVAYGVPRLGGMFPREDARRVPLFRFPLHCGERFRYEYDFTADWKLDIRLERVLPFDPKRALPSENHLSRSGLDWCSRGTRTTRPSVQPRTRSTQSRHSNRCD